MSSHTVKLKPRFPSLETIGIASRRFPEFTNFRQSLQSVDVVLISFLLKGKTFHVIDNERLIQKAPSIAITHYGSGHTMLTEKGKVDIINIYLNLEKYPLPPLPPPLDRVLPDVIPIHPRFQNKLNRVLMVNFDSESRAAELALALNREMENKDSGFEQSMLMYFKLLLIDISRQVLRSGIQPSVKMGSANIEKLEKIRRFLDNNYQKEQKLDTLAESVKMKKSTLCREFKKYTGKTLFNYLLERRIQAAMLQLQTSGEKIINIAIECGFNDLSHFNRIFKRFTGTTPSQYRTQP